MSYIVKSMVVECPVAGRTREVAFANGCLVIKDVDPMEFLPLVTMLAGDASVEPLPTTATAPDAPPQVEQAAESSVAEALRDDSKVLGKRRVARKPNTKTAAEATPTSKKEPEKEPAPESGTGTASNPRSVARSEDSPGPSAALAKPSLNGTGSAASPRKVQSAALQPEAPEPDEPEPEDITEEDLPDGWAREMMDGKMTTFHVACGGTTCLCSITEEARVEAPPVIEVLDQTADAPEETAAPELDDADPLLVELRGAKRLLKVVDKLMEAGFKTPDDIMAQCEHYRSGVPLLARISDSQWQERIAVALEVSGL